MCVKRYRTLGCVNREMWGLVFLRIVSHVIVTFQYSIIAVPNDCMFDMHRHAPNITTSCKRNAPKSFGKFQREWATRHTYVSSAEKNRRRMLCAGDVANAGVASCAAGAEFGWYLATCVINTSNFVSANHSKILTQHDDFTKLPSHDTSSYSILSNLIFLTDFNGSGGQPCAN